MFTHTKGLWSAHKDRGGRRSRSAERQEHASNSPLVIRAFIALGSCSTAARAAAGWSTRTAPLLRQEVEGAGIDLAASAITLGRQSLN